MKDAMVDDKGRLESKESKGFLPGLIRLHDSWETPDLLGYLGLLFYSFFALLDVSKANIGLIMMMAGLFLKQGTKWRGFSRDPFLILSCAFLLYTCIVSLLAALEFPHLTWKILDAAKNWPVRGFFSLLIVAFWISSWKTGQTDRLCALIVFLIFCGFLVRVFLRLDWVNLPGQLHGFWSGQMRASFGYSSVNLGTWSAMLMLGLIICARRWMGEERAGSFPVRFLSWAGAFVIIFLCLLFSQSRTAWVATLMTVPSFGAASLFFARVRRKRICYWMALCLFLVIILLVPACSDMIRNRLMSEYGSVVLIVSGGSADVCSPELLRSSIGQHWLLFGAFWKEFLSRPLIGWGPGTMEALIDSSGLSEAAGLRFPHFHNSYFNVLAEFGIIGFGMVSLMFFLIFRAAWMNFRKGLIPSDLFFLVVGTLTIFGLCALTGEPLQSTNGGHVISLLGGISYSLNMSGSAMQEWSLTKSLNP